MNGIRYVVITYPGYISLPEKHPIIFQLNGVNVLAVIHNHLEALQVIDFNNGLTKDENGKVTLKKTIESISDINLTVDYRMGEAETLRTYVYDYKLDTEKCISTKFFTILMIAYEVNNPENISQEDYDFLDVIISEFIHLYKYISKDSRVRIPKDIVNDRIIEKEAVVKYTDEEKLKPINERFLPRDLNIGIKRFTAMQPKESVPQSNDKILRNYQVLGLALTQGITLKEELRLLEKAFEEADLNSNYKYAFLESFIAAESVISMSLRKIKQEKGVSNTKLKEYAKEVGIGYQINVEIPVLLDNLTDDERQILGNINKIRKIRNEVIHEGISVSEETALEAISSVSKLIEIFSRRNLP